MKLAASKKKVIAYAAEFTSSRSPTARSTMQAADLYWALEILASWVNLVQLVCSGFGTGDGDRNHPAAARP